MQYKVTISTLFTLSRVFLIPFIIYSMLSNEWGAACIYFSAGAVTDALDGSLARYLNQETALGAYLDPLADKLFILSCYASLAYVNSSLFTIPIWFLVIVFCKEFLLVAGALYAGVVKKAVLIRPTWLGKFTMAIQVLFIGWLFLSAFLGQVSNVLLSFFLMVIIVLSLAVFFQYAYIGYKGLTHETE